jgi:tryptophan synthase alpha chain
MNRLTQAFEQKPGGLLNIFFTAGYPKLDSTVPVALDLTANGVDMIELGMPYSDPLADGATIQMSSAQALKNGMQVDILFEQVRTIRATSEIPIILMGYLNQIMKYGQDKFLAACAEAGVDGLIIPDLPMDIYEQEFMSALEENDIKISFLVTPKTSDERIRLADALSTGFIYVVADNSITGAASGNTTANQEQYFAKIRDMKLRTPTLIGFGITNKVQFETACQYANGAIIGSEFIRQIATNDSSEHISRYIKSIKN